MESWSDGKQVALQCVRLFPLLPLLAISLPRRRRLLTGDVRVDVDSDGRKLNDLPPLDQESAPELDTSPLPAQQFR